MQGNGEIGIWRYWDDTGKKIAEGSFGEDGENWNGTFVFNNEVVRYFDNVDVPLDYKPEDEDSSENDGNDVNLKDVPIKDKGGNIVYFPARGIFSE